MISPMAQRARKKLTQIQIKLSQQVLPLCIVLMACLAIIGLIIFQTTHHKKPEQYYTVTNWSQETAQGFFNECVYTAQGPSSRISKEAAKIYCGCNVDALQSIYKNEDELELSEKDWPEKGFSPEAVSVMRKCAEKAHTPINIPLSTET